MKKITPTLCLLLLALASQAQDYAIINPQRTNYYATDSLDSQGRKLVFKNVTIRETYQTSAAITYAIDTLKIDEEDNYEYYPSWMGSYIDVYADSTVLGYGYYNEYSVTYTIKHTAQLHDTWVWDASGTQATVSNIDTATYAGITDTVKTISIGTKYLKISRTLGLVASNFFLVPPSEIYSFSMYAAKDNGKYLDLIKTTDVSKFDIGDESHADYESAEYIDGNIKSVTKKQITTVIDKQILDNEMVYTLSYCGYRSIHINNDTAQALPFQTTWKMKIPIFSLDFKWLYLKNDSLLSYSLSDYYSLPVRLDEPSANLKVVYQKYGNQSSGTPYNCDTLLATTTIKPYEYAYAPFNPYRTAYYKYDQFDEEGQIYILRLPALSLTKNIACFTFYLKESSKSFIAPELGTWSMFSESLPSWIGSQIQVYKNYTMITYFRDIYSYYPDYYLDYTTRTDYVIRHNAQLNETWNWGGLGAIAKVTHIDTATYLGVTDTIKTITIGNKYIKISKTMGMVASNFFKDEAAQSTIPISICGITNPNKGMYKITYAELNNIGDESHTYFTESSTHYPAGDTHTETKKVIKKVVDKQTNNNEVTFKVAVCEQLTSKWESGQPIDSIFHGIVEIRKPLAETLNWTWIPKYYENKSRYFVTDRIAVNIMDQPYSNQKPAWDWNPDYSYSERLSLVYQNYSNSVWGTPYNCDSLLITSVVAPAMLQNNVFPNPAYNQVTIQIAQQSTFDVRLYNYMGKEVWQQQTTNSTITIPRGTLQSGVYMYRITDANQHVAKGKIVFQ